MIRTSTIAAAAVMCAGVWARGAAQQITAADSAMWKRADHARIEGSPTATVWLVEMSDFQCPFCRRWHEETYPIIKKEYVDTGKIRLAYINFPLSMHKNSKAAARAAMCAAGQDKFWAMHDALFQSQARWEGLANPMPVYDSLATASGADVRAMHQCLASGIMDKLIDGDSARAAGVGVRSTPSFTVTGIPQLIEGAQPIALFRQALDAALAAPGKP